MKQAQAVILTWVGLAAGLLSTANSSASGQTQPELQTPSRPPSSTVTAVEYELVAPDPPGGSAAPPDGAMGRSEAAEGGLPNLAITSVQIVGSNGAPIVPTAGKKFWVRVNYRYSNSVCTPYAIRRLVNGWEHNAPEINWGCGFNGTTFWFHIWGTWVMHHGGTYSTTVTLDADNVIAESIETDNTFVLNFDVTGDITAEWSRVNAEAGRFLLGDGTDVVVGTMGTAFDFNHPWFTGVDSQGRPRLVAANQNALGEGGSPLNAGHETAVMGIVLARGDNDGDITGLAPDARYVTAEFYNGPPGFPVLHIVDAAGFLVEHGAEVINMSWGWCPSSLFICQTGEGSVSNLMTDYLAYGRNIVCVPAVGQFPIDTPSAPAAARNVITVGGLKDNLQEAWGPQNHGPTLDGRSKPDLLGNDSANTVATRDSWRNGFPAAEGFYGTSFAAPFVTGAVAQLLDFGKHNAQNTDHRVIKALIMNSGVKALDADGSPWSNTPTQPLDDEQGTGILDLVRAHAMYSAGEQTPASILPNRLFYQLGTAAAVLSRIDVTLVWDRHTFWSDANGNSQIDAGDSFFTRSDDQQDNLDLVLYRDGVEVAASRSVVDNVEHISVADALPGTYEVHVERQFLQNTGGGEEYAIAWYADGVPAMAGYDFGEVTCPGDVNGDNTVTGLDVTDLLACFGFPASPGCEAADINNDGTVNVLDLIELLLAFGTSCP